jgi:hypothetical protein
MQKVIIFILIIVVSMFALNSCYYDKESQLYPVGSTNCDTTNITYSITIRNILQNNTCLGCHSGSGASGGNIILDNYSSVRLYAQNGKLYGTINHSPGFVPMPQSGGKISPCDIKKVKNWIDSGTQNN